MAKIKHILTGNRKHPEVVTGKFDLHYEDVLPRGRGVAVVVLAFGVITAATVLPLAVYRSYANSNSGVIIKVQNGTLGSGVSVGTSLDSSGYVEFLEKNGTTCPVGSNLSQNNCSTPSGPEQR